ncbi:phosphatidate cytidylyltransferase [Calothrix sp. UHCC 0171]|uniref:diacylglycerol/polyprenol kinase family protein n=1 Tax=Calothrix sp. UHCC 0171 TaxID=3110245 RepID=UPI002B1FDB04|nr:phosphatidate cytidylyltransferase [Calothrix sp. UHCC 0171]MEA5569734.1 phosphatidate cytidylyltransferase [Calothrix sp. UHCC 0171]
MTANDYMGLVISYTYATALLIIGETLRRVFAIKPDLTRKFIHIGAGMWIFGVLALFNSWEIGIIPFASFIFLNYLFYRYRLVSAMDTSSSSPGTIYFAISVTLLFAVFWRPLSVDQVPIATAGVMAMTWGDALAALIGKNYGKHKYQFAESTRTWEGSLVMFVTSVVVIFLVLTLLPTSIFSPNSLTWETWIAIVTAVVAAAAATLVEAVSPHGTDNLTVPLVTAGFVGIVYYLT